MNLKLLSNTFHHFGLISFYTLLLSQFHYVVLLYITFSYFFKEFVTFVISYYFSHFLLLIKTLCSLFFHFYHLLFIIVLFKFVLNSFVFCIVHYILLALVTFPY
jgi:hypothetical protein